MSETVSTNPMTKLAIYLAIALGIGFFAWPPKDKVTLGLDLQGGTHMVLEVDLDEAVRTNGERTLAQIRKLLQEKGVEPESTEQPKPGTLIITGLAADKAADIDSVLDLHQGSWSITRTGTEARLEMRGPSEAAIRTGAANQVKETITRRIDEFGVLEPQVTTSGANAERIVVQLPGLDDVERVKRIITKSSVMDFRLGHGEGATSEELTARLGGTVPDSMEILTGAPGTRQAGRVYAVDRVAVVRGEDLIDARERPDEFGKPSISFTLNPDAGKSFGDFTGAHVQEPLAIVLDGQVVQYATIQSRIFSEGRITGARSLAEAQDDALTLRSGALPAKVSILFEQTVGPALGKDSIHSGLRAALIGFILVVAFMLLLYKGAGLNAIFALTLNLVLTTGLLALVGATLTLPGIAGIVLTIGMAVDANVIIFERIKEEMLTGKSARACVDAGFAKAFSAILDGHVTPIIAAFFLLNFGTGPIKGFAVTLIIGLSCSMFTAVWVSHAIFDVLFHFGYGKKGISIQWRPLRAPSWPFMKLAPITTAISALTVVIAIALLLTVGVKRGVDFQGGTEVVVKARDAMSAEDIRARLHGTEFAGITIQEYGKTADHQFLLRILDAGGAVATAEVNAGEGAHGGDKEAASTRLTKVLAAGDGSGLDLNSVGRDELSAAVMRGAALSAVEAEAAADAIVAARTNSGGIFRSAEEAAAAPGLSSLAGEWIKANASVGSFSVLNVVNVGPAAGAELAKQAIKAVLWSMLGILGYMALRFDRRFAVAAVIAIAHDVMLTIGIVVALHKEFDISVIAALLTLVGYSVNDTIILFDRVRENLATHPNMALRGVLNLSVNQTLMRTILTSTTVFLACISLLLFGGEVLEGFSLVMTIGVVTGTYSTTFVASPIVLFWEWLRARSKGTGVVQAA